MNEGEADEKEEEVRDENKRQHSVERREATQSDSIMDKFN